MENVVKMVAKQMKITPPKLILTSAKRGHVNFYKKHVFIPEFAYKKMPKAYTIYYIIHEMVHFRYPNHGYWFKKKEEELLRLWGIEIERAKIYPKRLIENGEVVYYRKRKV